MRSSPPALSRYTPAVPVYQQGYQTRQASGEYSRASPPIKPNLRTDAPPPHKNFFTLPINRTTSRGALPFTSNSYPSLGIPNPSSTTSTSPNVKMPDKHYKTFSHSPFGVARRAPITLDRYPEVLTLNEVNIKPVSETRPPKQPTSGVPSVLERYPPGAGEEYNLKSPTRNSPLPRINSMSLSSSPTLSPRSSNQKDVDNKLVLNRFRYPNSPSDTLNKNSPPSPRPPLGAVWSARADSRETTPPPPPPIIEAPKNTAPPPPKRQTPNTAPLQRKPSLKVKRSLSGVSSNAQNLKTQSTRRRAPPSNQPSKLLADHENEMVYRILGTGRQVRYSVGIVYHGI